MRRSHGWRAAAYGLSCLAVGLAALMQGCPSRVAEGPEGRATTPARETDNGLYRRAATQRPRRGPEVDELLRDALAGTVEAAEDDVSARLQLRDVRIPRPARGATARFNFDDGKRGFITALPNEEILTTPAYASGRIFLGGGFASHQFYAFNAYSGELDWAMAAPDGGPTAAIIEDDRVIFNTESCTIFVADAATGTLRWSRWLGDPLMSQPAASAGLVMSAYPADGGHRFGAFRLSDGEPVWSIPIPADVIQAPHVSGDSVYFATMAGNALRVRVRSGDVVWEQQADATSALWVDRGHVLLTRRVDRGGRTFEQPIVLSASNGRVERRGEVVAAPYLGETQTRDRELVHGQSGAWGNVPSGDRLALTNVAAGWAFQGSSPTASDGRAYYAVGGRIVARDIATGEAVWERSYRAGGNAQAVTPPAVVGSQLVFGTVDGHLYFTDIDTGMTVRAYALGEPIVFQPIVAQGWVYVATARGNLIGLEVGDPRLDGWHMWGGNARHAGAVEHAGEVDPGLLASLARPSQGTLEVAAVEEPDGETDAEEETATDATPAPAPASAAIEQRERLPLLSTRVDARVSGLVARVTVTQRFENPHERPIEALYLFPLPEEAAVDDMVMRIGERVVRGRIQRRAEARRTYEEARQSGRRAALLEQQRPNLFAQRVANIAPGEAIEVELRYVQMLPFEEGSYELVFPMVAPPRFDPSDPGAVVPRADELRAASEVELSVSVDAGLPIERIESPTHRVEIGRPSARTASVRLAASDRIPNRDFILRYALGGETPRATVLAHRGPEQGHFTLVVQPPAAPADDTIAPRAITFVVDTSSSMAGAPMNRAREVLRRALHGLRPADSFRVIAFSDRVETLAGGRVAATEANVTRAIAEADAIRAVGATRMVPAITEALGEQMPEGALPILVLLTDGFIGNEAEVLRAIATDLGDRRLYAVGIGSAVNRFLLTRAAEIGRGHAMVTTLSEDGAAAADRFATLIDRPVYTDVEVDWGGLQVSDVYPRRLPDLFAGAPLVVHGRFRRGGTAEVSVRGSVNGTRYERVIPVTLPAAPTDDTHVAHATLWARAAVHDRMNRIYLRDDAALIEEVTALGLEHRMVTQYTSFVAVDDAPAAADEDAEAAETTRPTVSPARSLPGDPEIRIPASEDALAVTVVLPFGETIAAAWETELGLWTARFLVPADAREGTYPVEIIVTLASGEQERMRVWYTVDASAPMIDLAVEGDAHPGAEVTIRASQRITDADLRQVGRRRPWLTDERVQLLSDARRVELRDPRGAVIEMRVDGPGRWVGRYRIPADAAGTLRLEAVVVDLAANVRTQPLDVEVLP